MCEIRPVVQKEMSFENISVFTSGGLFVQQCGPICAILVGEHFCKTKLF